MVHYPLSIAELRALLRGPRWIKAEDDPALREAERKGLIQWTDQGWSITDKGRRVAASATTGDADDR